MGASSSQYSWSGKSSAHIGAESRQSQFKRWILLAVILGLLVHVAIVFAMQKVPVESFDNSRTVRYNTDQILVAEVDDEAPEPMDDPEPEVKPITEVKQLDVTELDIIDNVPHIDTDLKVELKPRTTLGLAELAEVKDAGNPLGEASEATLGRQIESELKRVGEAEDYLQPAHGQILVDPGVQDSNLLDENRVSEDILKGVGGTVGKGGAAYTDLKEMLGLPEDDLVKQTGTIGSDLLFEFNSTVLKGNARHSLMDISLLIDKNPDLVCWIEGHTDSIGSDSDNYELSLARAQAVKEWLVKSQRIDPELLFVRAFGEAQLKVKQGDKDAQAINRRVEIKMRKTPPPKPPVAIPVAETVEEPVEEKPAEEKPKIITPNRNPNTDTELPIQEDSSEPPNQATPEVSPEDADLPPVPVHEQPTSKAIVIEEPSEATQEQVNEEPHEGSNNTP